jgi:hypothetical protein
MTFSPFDMLEPLLGADLTALQVSEIIIPALVDAGLEDTCGGLVNFLAIALVPLSAKRS